MVVARLQRQSDLLLVDDEPEVRSMLSDVFSDEYRCQTAPDGRTALELAGRHPFDVIVSDIAMPNMDGLELLDKVLAFRPPPKVILMTGRATMQSARKALRRGAFDYIQKPFMLDQLKRIIEDAIDEEPITGIFAAEARTSAIDIKPLQDMHESFAKLQVRLDTTCMEAIMALVAAVEAKDPFTEQHSRRVSDYAVELGTRVKLEERELETLRIASLLHDIGKIGIPDSILTKPGKLTDIEFALVKKHCEMGVRILESVGFLGDTLPPVLHHHEWWNGTGYPRGLVGDAIPHGARLLQAADCVDAMRCQRSYKQPMTVEEIAAEFEANAGIQFDPEIAALTLEWLRGNPTLDCPGRR